VENVKGKKVTVLGAARSGVAAAELLKLHGAIVFVSDTGTDADLMPYVGKLRSLSIPYETGRHSDKVFDAELIVLSPGIPTKAPVIVEAEKRNIPVVSELEFASWFCHAPMVAVTGTNGKTTTTALLGRLFHDAKRKHIVGGNIGDAFSGLVSKLDKDSVAVLEVSSFQLDFCRTFHPHVSVLLNLTPDHLDRYDGSFEKYMASKSRIFERQTEQDFLIYNYDDQETCEMVRRLASLHVRVLAFGIDQRYDEGAFVEDDKLVTVIGGERHEIVETELISIRGRHNLYNAMAATLAAQIMSVPIPSIRATLKNFKGVEHRLEFVRELNDVKYINDSKATNVDSVWYALEAYQEPIVLLLGGRDKGNDYSKLIDPVEQHVKAIVAIGESAGTVVSEFSTVTKVVKSSSMDEAVNMARGLAAKGDIVMLSPACASFDWFRNYEHRGKVFKQLVNALQ
jgi:UDP-N-acetylmuramoylalanine--D-glutamate ligase